MKTVVIIIIFIWLGFLLGAVVVLKITVDKIVRDTKKLEKGLSKWANPNDR